jgi:hypothetical protein
MRIVRAIAFVALLAAVFLGAGCAHRYDITPPLHTLEAQGIVKINKTVGYYISPTDRSKVVETPGGGGDSVKYLPYQQSEPPLQQVLSNLFTKVVSIPALDDREFIASNNIAYVFVPTIETGSASDSASSWAPTRFTMTLDGRAIDRAGVVVWQKRIQSEGRATVSELQADRALAARRASRDVFLRLQQEISAAREFR